MTRKELARRVASRLHESEIRKHIAMKKQVFHISDDNGNQKDFVVKQSDKTVMYTIEDVEIFLDTCVSVIEDAIKHGESVTYRNFGTLGLRYRKPRKTKRPMTDEWVDVEARYIPKFSFGNGLRMAARQYELLLSEKDYNEPLPLFDIEPEEDDE